MSIQPLGSINDILQPRISAQKLFNIINPPTSQAVDNRPWWAANTATTIFDQLFNFSLNQYQPNTGTETETFEPTFINMYLQYPNEKLQELADYITDGLTEDDDKATAIIWWTLFNFPYKTDKENYGYDEMWVPPTFALAKGSGDCEDGAFLVHSLMLHAGIPYNRIRTYGGFVDSGDGAASGGHAWTAYRRETDDEWVVLDTSYYPNLRHVDDRTPMRKIEMYRENYFFFNKLTWTTLEGIDRIHNPGAWYNYSVNGTFNSMLKTAGMLISRYA